MRTLLAAVVVCGILPQAYAKKVDKAVDTLGPYRLGVSYDSMKSLPGFKLDEQRSKPGENIVSAKIIDKRVAGTPTIQRFTFKSGVLTRVSIIFHPPETWTEAAVKAWLLPQWGDPGEKEKADDTVQYIWSFKTTLGALLPADGNRWMASLMTND